MSPVPAIIDHLSDRISRLEGGNTESTFRPWPTGLAQIDEVLPAGGLARGSMHEWCSGAAERDPRRWTPPISLATHLVPAAGSDAASSVVWIGPRVWPSCAAIRSAGILDVSVFVRASRVNDRLWACETLLRSGAAVLVVLDGSGMDLTMTRRLQLAARSGPGTVFSLRPERELCEPSAATTRWLVSPQPTTGTRPRWRVELVRCKGPQPMTGSPRRWVVEQNYDGTGVMCVSDQLGDGSGSTPVEQQHRTHSPVASRWSA